MEECGREIIPGLLFANETSLFASDEPVNKKSLDVLVRWCILDSNAFPSLNP